jgi:hypothetical protein
VYTGVHQAYLPKGAHEATLQDQVVTPAVLSSKIIVNFRNSLKHS